MVRKGGLEPPRLSAPPPQDGVSANSTTSARCNYRAVNILARSTRESNSSLHPIPRRSLSFYTSFARPNSPGCRPGFQRHLSQCIDKVDRIAFFIPHPSQTTA
jgi:hypothetical protein